jgi:hypothetical protein
LILVPEKVVSCPTAWLFNKGPPAPAPEVVVVVVKHTARSTKGKEKGMKEASKDSIQVPS